MRQLVREMKRLCREYRGCCTEVERREECREVRQELFQLCRNVQSKLDITEAELLLALLEAYEVTGDEVMLQRVLDVVSGNLEQLSVSAEHVKLLAYCYYYVEEEECAERARGMLEELKGKTDGERWREAEQVYRELVGQD